MNENKKFPAYLFTGVRQIFRSIVDLFGKRSHSVMHMGDFSLHFNTQNSLQKEVEKEAADIQNRSR